MTKQEPKVHVLKDESLGGIEREYIEVDRKAEVGDYVSYKGTDIIGKFRWTDDIYSYVDNDGAIDGKDVWHNCDTTTLKPTGIVHVWVTAGNLTGLVRYRLVDRKAEVGEKVIITKGDGWYEGEVGSLYMIIDGKEFGRNLSSNADYLYVAHEDNNELMVNCVNHEDYSVLVNVNNEAAENCCEADACVNESEASPQVIDMLANLSRRIVALDSQLTATQRNVETLARELEGVKHAQKPSSAHLLAEAFEALARHEGGVSR